METEIRAKPDLKVIQEEEIPHILELGEVGAVLELVVKNKEGKVTEKQVLKSRSFVRQFLELLWVQTLQIPEVVSYDIRDITNTVRSICESGNTFLALAYAADTTRGIMVGTGSTAPTIDDYALETQIAHGAGPGQLDHSVGAFGAPASDSTTSQFTQTRNFANASGGDITVNEIGLYIQGFKYTTSHYFLAIRDVIPGGILVPNGQTLTVNYRIQAVI